MAKFTLGDVVRKNKAATVQLLAFTTGRPMMYGLEGRRPLFDEAADVGNVELAVMREPETSR